MSTDCHHKEIMRLLKSHGATLKRQNKHLVYELPDGKTFVMASTPSDRRARINSLRDLKKLLGVKEVRRKATVRRNKPGASAQPWQGFKPAPLQTPKTVDLSELSLNRESVVVVAPLPAEWLGFSSMIDQRSWLSRLLSTAANLATTFPHLLIHCT